MLEGQQFEQIKSSSVESPVVFHPSNKMIIISDDSRIKKSSIKPSLLNDLDDNGDTALMRACKKGSSYLALKIIETNQHKPEIINKDGDTALLCACATKLTDVAFE